MPESQLKEHFTFPTKRLNPVDGKQVGMFAVGMLDAFPTKRLNPVAGKATPLLWRREERVISNKAT